MQGVYILPDLQVVPGFVLCIHVLLLILEWQTQIQNNLDIWMMAFDRKVKQGTYYRINL